MACGSLGGVRGIITAKRRQSDSVMLGLRTGEAREVETYCVRGMILLELSWASHRGGFLFVNTERIKGSGA